MIKYPNGKLYQNKPKIIEKHRHILNASNRGMSFEEEINKINQFYLENNIAVITKRPTPIKVVNVDYKHNAKITNAYFEKPSTVDYNGVYKGHYLDFEAKSTLIKSRFPLKNITLNQIKHLEQVIHHRGIAFFLIEFKSLMEIYFLDAKYVIDYYYYGARKSIPYPDIKKRGQLLKRGFNPPFNYLAVVDQYLN